MTTSKTGARGRLIVIAAGGTGGHLFPAQAAARELVDRGYKVALITDARGKTFTDKFPEADIYTVSAATFAGRGALGKVTAAFSIAAGLFQGWALLGRLKPAVVLGLGGYPALPAMVGAALRGLPTCIHEQNSVLGRVNRFMSRRVDVIACAFDELRGARDADRKKVAVIGNPMREPIVKQAGAPYEPIVPGGPIRVLVFGGSQGARVQSRIIPKAFAALPDDLRARLDVTQQCREEDLDTVRKIYDEKGIKAHLSPFITDMAERMAAAHLVLGRAGASTVTEIALIGRPAILVPLPIATDDHQTHNAMHLVNHGGGWCIQEKDFTVEGLRDQLNDLFEDGAILARTAEGALTAARPDAARRLGDIVDGLATKGRAYAADVQKSAQPSGAGS